MEASLCNVPARCLPNYFRLKCKYFSARNLETVTLCGKTNHLNPDGTIVIYRHSVSLGCFIHMWSLSFRFVCISSKLKTYLEQDFLLYDIKIEE